MKKIFVVLLALLAAAALELSAQNLKHYKGVVKELSSKKYQGRGYALGGANKAGVYLKKQFLKGGVDTVICQPFTININTFPGTMKLSVDGKKLKAGKDFTVREYCPGVKGEYVLYQIDTAAYDSAKIFEDLAKPEYKDAFVVCDFWFTYKHRADFKRLQSKEGCQNAGLIYTWSEPLKFYKAYGEKVFEKPNIWTTVEALPKTARTIKVDIENKFFENYELFNVIAKVQGSSHDSCYVFTAHYDHLGNLGKDVYYPGTNDNASGTAMVVTLAEYYAKNRPDYDMYFIAFSGEDANLRGSEWYAKNPIVPLTQIKYLFNIDMIGDNNPVLYCETSDSGLKRFPLWEAVNADGGYFKGLNRGALAANSDHYPFAERGVPCIFLENKEGDAFPYYHTPQDNWKNVVTDTYEPLFKLIVDFVRRVGN